MNLPKQNHMYVFILIETPCTKYAFVPVICALISVNTTNNWIFLKDLLVEPAPNQLQTQEETPVQEKMIVDVEDGLNEPSEAVKSKVSTVNKSFTFQVADCLVLETGLVQEEI